MFQHKIPKKARLLKTLKTKLTKISTCVFKTNGAKSYENRKCEYPTNNDQPLLGILRMPLKPRCAINRTYNLYSKCRSHVEMQSRIMFNYISLCVLRGIN